MVYNSKGAGTLEIVVNRLRVGIKVLRNRRQIPNKSLWVRFLLFVGFPFHAFSSVEKLDRDAQILEGHRDRKRWEFLGRAYVTFQSQKSALKMLDLYSNFWWNLARKTLCCASPPLFDGVLLKAVRPPEPDNILWQNQEGSTLNRFARIVLAMTLSFMLIALTTYGSVELLVLRAEWGGDSFLSYCISFLVSFINFVDLELICYFSEFERHRSRNSRDRTIFLRSTLTSILNSGIVILAVLILELPKESTAFALFAELYMGNVIVNTFLPNITFPLYMFRMFLENRWHVVNLI